MFVISTTVWSVGPLVEFGQGKLFGLYCVQPEAPDFSLWLASPPVGLFAYQMVAFWMRDCNPVWLYCQAYISPTSWLLPKLSWMSCSFQY